MKHENLRLEVAKLIHKYRVQEGLSFRDISDVFTGEENQMVGIELCRHAERVLGFGTDWIFEPEGAEKMNFEEGKIYKVRHSRKGIFHLYVLNQDDTWLTGRIIKGHAKAMLEYNEKYVGDEITVRKSFLTKPIEVKEVQPKEGCRMLEPDETPKKGDWFRLKKYSNSKWFLSNRWEDDPPLQSPDCHYCRPIEVEQEEEEPTMLDVLKSIDRKLDVLIGKEAGDE